MIKRLWGRYRWFWHPASHGTDLNDAASGCLAMAVVALLPFYVIALVVALRWAF